MSASMVFAATSNNNSTVNHNKVTAKSTKHSKQKNTKKANKVNQQPQVAAKALPQPQIKPFHELPALHIWGYGGSHTIGQGQGLMPLMSSNQSKNLYVLAEGKETANTAAHYFGVGGGYRQVVNNRIFGGYFIVDDNFTDHLGDKNFFVLNPGFETLGDRWDFRVNGYFPVGSKSWDTGDSYNNTHFSGHDAFADLYENDASIGNGADAEIGAKVPKFDALKVFVGGYYFNEENTGSITGASGRVEYKINDYLSLEVRDTYDNYYDNMTLVGFKVSLGGVQNQGENGISDRLLDPIEHNLATAALANSVPIRTSSKLLAANQQTNTDPIEFVDNDDMINSETFEDGTYEHPYSQLNDDVITDIENQGLGNAITIYVDNGTYSLNGALDLPDQYSIYGRTNDFMDAATGNNRPELDGTINVDGSSTIDSVKIMNDGDEDQGIYVVGAENQNVILNNIVVGTTDPDNVDKSYVTGININNATVTMSNSDVYGYDTSREAAGITMVNDATLNLGANNVIGAYESGSEDIAVGIEMSSTDGSSNTVNIRGNNNMIYGTNTAGSNAWGIYIGGESTGVVNIFSANNTIYGEASGDGQEGGYENFGYIVAGIFSDYDSIATVNILGNNNTIYGSDSISNSSGDEAAGILLNGEYETSSTVNILSMNNTIYGENKASSNVNNSYAYGIYLETENNTLNISGDKNNIYGNNFNGYAAFGIVAFNYGGQTNINITSDGNVISASSTTNDASFSSDQEVAGIYSDGNLSIAGSNNTINATTNVIDNTPVGVNYVGNGNLLIANTTINATNNSTLNYEAIGVLIGTLIYSPSEPQPNSVTLSNNAINVINESLSGGHSEGIFIESSDTSNFVIEDNALKVTNKPGGAISYGIASDTSLGSNKTTWLNDNTFSGDITDANRVVD
jgi:hypothetical protein